MLKHALPYEPPYIQPQNVIKRHNFRTLIIREIQTSELLANKLTP